VLLHNQLHLQDPLFGGGDSSNVRHGSFTNPTGPPPPYESVITDSASHSIMQAPPEHHAAAAAAESGMQAGAAAAANGSSSAGGGPAYSSDFEIMVSDPVKQGEGVSAYVSYKVCMLLASTYVCWAASGACACVNGLTASQQCAAAAVSFSKRCVDTIVCLLAAQLLVRFTSEDRCYNQPCM
jgi:hypothetical protein